MLNNSKSRSLIGIVLSVILATSLSSIAHADGPINHSGGTDKCGCHTSSKTGEYHCHTRKKRGGDCPAVTKNEEVQNEATQSGHRLTFEKGKT